MHGGQRQVAPATSSLPCDSPKLLLIDGEVAVRRIRGCDQTRVSQLELEGG
jgi:hypothetical protein